MSDTPPLTHPWLVAVWPGMGGVGLNAGVYLLAKLGMSAIAEVDGGDLFDVERVDVEGGLIQPGRRPRSRLFLWHDPNGRHDLVVFLGEAQPPVGKYAFCRQLIRYAQEYGVERIITFAAMATQAGLTDRGRVFAAATDADTLAELRRLDLDILNEGSISGLNGVLLGAAAEAGLRGACLLGEMPHMFAQLPYPKASLAVLEAFAPMAGLDLDLTELSERAAEVSEQLGKLLERAERAQQGEDEDEDEEDEEDEATVETNEEEEGEDWEGYQTPTADEPVIAERAEVERLFGEAAADRSKAFELKQLLDRLGLYREYEDRFLDLFHRRQGDG